MPLASGTMIFIPPVTVTPAQITFSGTMTFKPRVEFSSTSLRFDSTAWRFDQT